MLTLREEIAQALRRRITWQSDIPTAIEAVLARRLDREALARVIEETAKQYEAAASPPELREGCSAIALAVISHITGEAVK